MGPVSAFVLFVLILTLVFFVALPLRLETQGDAGEVEMGAHAPSHANFSCKRKPKIGAHGKPVLFLHPKDFNGCLVELEEV